MRERRKEKKTGRMGNHGAPECATTYLRELRSDGGADKSHGENGADEINKSQREKKCGVG